jgi:hypothetical protein
MARGGRGLALEQVVHSRCASRIGALGGLAFVSAAQSNSELVCCVCKDFHQLMISNHGWRKIVNGFGPSTNPWLGSEPITCMFYLDGLLWISWVWRQWTWMSPNTALATRLWIHYSKRTDIVIFNQVVGQTLPQNIIEDDLDVVKISERHFWFIDVVYRELGDMAFVPVTMHPDLLFWYSPAGISTVIAAHRLDDRRTGDTPSSLWERSRWSYLQAGAKDDCTINSFDIQNYVRVRNSLKRVAGY